MNEGQIPLESEFNKLSISDEVSNSANINHENCYQLVKDKFWCKECVPSCIIEGWTSGNSEIDKFIKDTIYNPGYFYRDGYYYPLFLEWVAFDRFENVKQIGEGGFAKVYSATWIDGRAEYIKENGNWEKLDSEPITVALKRLNGSQNISAKYLNELKIHWDFHKLSDGALNFYGITKYLETNEFMMIIDFMEQGNLKYVLSNNFNNCLWKNKIEWLSFIASDLVNLHKLKYCHRDFHSGNILHRDVTTTYLSDFGLSGPSNKQECDDKIYGVLPYIAPEVLNRKPYTLSSDIYSFGVIMTELSSGKPPFHKRKHNESLALEICNGRRPEFGKGTPEIYKKLAYRCMNTNPDQRPTADELYNIFDFWSDSIGNSNQEIEKFGYKRKEVNDVFKEADKEIPNISTLYEKDPDAIYTSRAFTFSNLTKPVNSSVFTDEENNQDCQDPQIVDLEVSSSLQLRDNDETN